MEQLPTKFPNIDFRASGEILNAKTRAGLIFWFSSPSTKTFYCGQLPAL